MTTTKLTCHEVSRILSDGLDKELPAGERARLRLHLVVCDACREVEQQMAFLREALSGSARSAIRTSTRTTTSPDRTWTQQRRRRCRRERRSCSPAAAASARSKSACCAR